MNTRYRVLAYNEALPAGASRVGTRYVASDGTILIPSISGGDFNSEDAFRQLKEAWDANQTELKGLLTKQDEEIKKYGGTATATSAELKAATERFDQIQAEAKGRLDEFEKNFTDWQTKMNRFDMGGGDSERKSFGTQFMESEAYKEYIANGEPRRGQGQAYGVKSFFERKVLTGATLGSTPRYLYQVQQVAGIIDSPDRQDRVRDLLPVIPTSSGAIEYIRETGFTNAAAPRAEGTDKPESSIAFEVVPTTVKTIAHWLPATRQIISDAPALEAYINSRLLIGLELVEDAQLLFGNGSGANIEGIMSVDDIQHYSIGDDVDSNGNPQTKLDALRRAMLKSRVAEYPTSGVVLHPNDWADIELLKDADGRYIWINVNSGGEQRVWRVPVIDTTAMTPGRALTGAFALGAAIYDREDANIRISDSHANTFIQNVWTILAEERLALVVYRPEAFVDVELEELS